MLKTYDNNGNRKTMEVMLSTSSVSKGNKLGITDIIQRVLEKDLNLKGKKGIQDSIIQILEFLLTGQPKQKGNQDGLTKTVLGVVSGTPFIYEYTYNTEDQLIKLYNPITDKTYNYTYDIKGNLTSKQDYYGSYNYSWDYKNRLVELKKFAVAGSQLTDIKYSYDSKDRRTKKVVIPPPTGGGIQTTTSYAYDNWSVLKETHENPSGSYTVDYSYKDDDTPQALTYNPADGGTSATYYYLNDGHGDIREITDKAGTTLVKYSYDAWGNPVNVTPVKTGVQETDELAKQLSTVNPYTYASYRYDSDTGLYYLRARYYDSEIGRFISKDPILKGSISNEIDNIARVNPFAKEAVDQFREQKQYAYTANNPINYVDTDGLWKAREHSKQTIVGALNVGFPYDAAEFMALMNFNFDVMYNAVAYPRFHFGRLNARQPKSHAYRYGKPWKHKHCRQRDYRVQYAIRKHNKAVYWKRRNGKYSANALVQLAYGLHAIQDIYAHLDATPWQHMRGKHANHYDETWWKPKRVKRSKRATKNYLRWYKNS